MKTYNFIFKVRIKAKKILLVLQFNQSQWLKSYIKINSQKRIETEKYGDKDGKALYKLIINAVYGKTMKQNENLMNEKDYPSLKMLSILNRTMYLKTFLKIPKENVEYLKQNNVSENISKNTKRKYNYHVNI